MIVAIVKIGTGLVSVEEFRYALDEVEAVSDFCTEHSPPLNTSPQLVVAVLVYSDGLGKVYKVLDIEPADDKGDPDYLIESSTFHY